MDKKEKIYIKNCEEKRKIIVEENDIYMNDKIKLNMFFLHKKGKSKPMIPIFFSSNNKLNKYIKENKNYLLENFGKLCENYYVENVVYSHSHTHAMV